MWISFCMLLSTFSAKMVSGNNCRICKLEAFWDLNDLLGCSYESLYICKEAPMMSVKLLLEYFEACCPETSCSLTWVKFVAVKRCKKPTVNPATTSYKIQRVTHWLYIASMKIQWIFYNDLQLFSFHLWLFWFIHFSKTKWSDWDMENVLWHPHQ